MKFQNIETKRSGLRCPIRVMNHTGDSIMTTYDTEVADSAAVATKDLQNFWNECIEEFESKGTTLTPNVFGRIVGGTDYDPIRGEQIKAPGFDVGLFEEIVIQPVPLGGG